MFTTPLPQPSAAPRWGDCFQGAGLKTAGCPHGRMQLEHQLMFHWEKANLHSKCPLCQLSQVPPRKRTRSHYHLQTGSEYQQGMSTPNSLVLWKQLRSLRQGTRVSQPAPRFPTEQGTCSAMCTQMNQKRL